MSTLYELTEKLNEIIMRIDEGDDTYSEDCLLDTWEMLDGEFDDKVDFWCKYIKNLSVEVNYLKVEKERLAKRQKTREQAILKMKSMLAYYMNKVDKTKIKTALFNVNRLKINGKLDITNKDVPNELKKEQISLVPDNDKIRELLDKGEKLPFARYYNSITIQ